MNTPDPSWDYTEIHEKLSEIQKEMRKMLDHMEKLETASETFDIQIANTLSDWKLELGEIQESLEDNL